MAEQKTREEIEREVFLKEVDEVLAQEKMRKFMKKYGSVFAAIAIIALLATGGYEFYKSVKQARIYRESAAYEMAAALVEKNKDEAIAEFSKLRQAGKTDYALLAAFSLASIYYTDGKVKESEAILTALGSDKKVPKVMRNLAKVSLVYQKQETDFSENTLSEIASVEKDAAMYKPLLTELKALQAYRNKDKAKTVAFYQEILNDKTASEAIKTRAKEVIGFLNE